MICTLQFMEHSNGSSVASQNEWMFTVSGLDKEYKLPLISSEKVLPQNELGGRTSSVRSFWGWGLGAVEAWELWRRRCSYAEEQSTSGRRRYHQSLS